MIASIDYEQLINQTDNSDIIESSLSRGKIGAVLITNLPKEFLNLREKLFKLSNSFSQLPSEIQDKYVHEKSKYSFGWSCGKEKMKDDEEPDLCKGSYYANPICDSFNVSEEMKNKFPSFYSDNIWPKELPDYESTFKQLGQFMYSLGLNMVINCDKYLEKKLDNYRKNSLFEKITNQKISKARLLHYYSPTKNLSEKEDGLCSWHLDHGCLTVLTAPMYLDKNLNQVPEPENSGLLIKNEHGETVKVTIPENAVLCQVGETLQVLSGGHLVANQHAVKPHNVKDISRETFPVFIDCSPMESIDIPDYGLKEDEVLETKFLPKGVPALKNRYEGCKLYHEFVTKTLSSYYKKEQQTM